MKYIIFLLSLLLFHNCTIKDTADYKTITKAVAMIKPHFNENGHDAILDEVNSMILYIYDGQEILYRIDTVSYDNLINPSGIEVTYLLNGKYTIVTWANMGKYSDISDMEIGKTRLSESSVCVVPDVSGDYISSDILMHNIFDFEITKGELRSIDIDLHKAVYNVTISIRGMEFLTSPQEYYFAIQHIKELCYHNQPKGDIVTYKPVLRYDSDAKIVSGAFNILRFPKEKDISIGIYNDSSGAEFSDLFETSIKEYLDNASGDLDTGGSVIIPVEITISTATVEITINDWSSGPIQRTDLGV